MHWFTSKLVEPIYRLVYGAPLDEPNARSTQGREGDIRNQRGLVLVADGVGGLDLCGTALRYVLGAERLPYAVQLFPWGHGLGRWFADLTNAANRDAKARLIADIVERHQTDWPGDPVFLVAKSGGSGVVVKALELLDEAMVERVVLLAPALSPAYDLTRALRAVRREIVVFWSPLDVIILGAGTRLFGTADRVKSVSAGLVGFQVPPRGELDLAKRHSYGKLRQVRWRPRMATTGYFGGHVGPDSPMFLRKYVVPLLRVEEIAHC
ncbi:MAG: serine aminopeptidase domain-containing protein [Isosphaerales bacterium]